MNLIIREAKIEDASILSAAEKEIAEIPGQLVSHPSELPTERFEKTISQILETKHGLYFVALSNNTIVGHALLEPLPLRYITHVAHLTLVVHQEWQGKGIGQLLLQKIIDEARKLPTIEKIELHVRSTNERAIALYKKMGFIPEGRLKNRVKLPQNQYADDILMAFPVKQHLQKNQISRVGVYGVAIKENKILLITQKSGPYQGKFDLPGGGIEFGESVEQTLRREFVEELNMGFAHMTLIDNLTTSVEMETYTFHQIGLIYAVKDMHPLTQGQAGALKHAWIDLKQLSQTNSSPFAWQTGSVREGTRTGS